MSDEGKVWVMTATAHDAAEAKLARVQALIETWTRRAQRYDSVFRSSLAIELRHVINEVKEALKE